MKPLLSGLVLAGLLAGAAAAETDCRAVWGALAGHLPAGLNLAGRPANPQDGFCVMTGVELPLGDGAGSVLMIDRVLVKGSALDWLVGTEPAPTVLEGRIEGLRVIPRSGNAALDYAAEAQARLSRTNASFLISWDAAARRLRLERMHIDLPGNNAIYLGAAAEGVDLSSEAAIQSSLSGFLLTRVEMDATLHGAFEWYLLPQLALVLLPDTGDAAQTAADLRAQGKAAIAALPETTFPPETKDALVRLIGELPNPSGRMRLDFRADPGFGLVRFVGYAMTGVPATLAEAAPLFQGVTLDLAWTHEDAE